MEKWVKEALFEAKIAYEKQEVPIGAVLVHENTIIAKAHNLVETKKDASAHAEMLCLKQASHYFQDWRLQKTILITTLEPCIMCAGALILHRVDKVIYLAKDLRHGAFGSHINILEKKHPIHHIEAIYLPGYDEAADLLKSFFAKRRQDANGKKRSIAFSADD